jgi:hypothetical protein
LAVAVAVTVTVAVAVAVTVTVTVAVTVAVAVVVSYLHVMMNFLCLNATQLVFGLPVVSVFIMRLL